MAIQTDLALKQSATTIKNETIAGANTALRIGTLLEDFVDSKTNEATTRTSISLTVAGASGAATYVPATGVFNIPTYTLAGLGGLANPMISLGDLLYGATAGAATNLAGNITAAKQYLSQTGNGSVSAAPVWSTIVGTDVTGAALTETDDTNVTMTLGGTPATALLRAVSMTLGWTGTLSVARGGTGIGTLTGVVIGTGTTAMTAIAGTASQLLRRNAGNTAYEFFTHDFINQAGARTAVSLTTTGTSGVATYTSGTGIFNIPNYTYTHPAYTAQTPTLTGALVLNTFTSDATGHITALTTRTLTLANLGATTVGNNLTILVNPTAVTFIRINADNTVSALDAATFRTAIGAGTSSTVGTVTSVGGTGTVSGLTLTGTVTSTGNLTLGGTLSVAASAVTAGTFGTGDFVFQGNLSIGGQVFSPTHAKGNITGATTVSFNDGNVQTMTLTGNVTFTFSNPQSGASYQLIITQDATGGRTIAWPTIHWGGKTVPTLTGTLNSKDIITITYDGATYNATILKNVGI